MTNPTAKAALPLRNDTILGVCEAIGEDFGFNANWLRVPLAALILVNPLYAVAAYLALGIVVAALRFAIPEGKPAPVAAASTAEPASALAADEGEPLQLAA